MPDLVSAAILSHEAPVEPTNQISTETICLLQKETATPKPVCIFHIVTYVRESPFCNNLVFIEVTIFKKAGSKNYCIMQYITV